MKKITTRVASYVKKHKKRSIIIGSIGALFLIIVISSLSGGAKVQFESSNAVIADITEEVSVTGKVAPEKKAELSFERAGTVKNIYVKVGDRIAAGDKLASLDSAESFAALKGAQANLLVERAKLTELEKGSRPEELAIAEAQAVSATASLTDARKALVVATRDAYIKIDDALRNNIDILFTNAQTSDPKLTVYTSTENIKRDAEYRRLRMTEALAQWRNSLALLNDTTTDVSAHITEARTNISAAKDFLAQLAFIISNLTSSGSSYSQATVNAYLNAVNTAQDKVNSASNAFTTADTALSTALSSSRVAQEEYNLKQSGSTRETIDAQIARVAQAAASVASYTSQYEKSTIVSPIEGIVARIVPEVGEIVTSGQNGFTVMSEGAFKIEVQVPEADIAKIQIGNKATITLDAYGSDTKFTATVALIDPAETIVEGVPTYKVTLQFDSTDDRIKSGMTANIDLVTRTRTNVVAVPSRSVFDKNGEKFIRIVRSDSETFDEVKITPGLKGSDGMTEIVSGVKAGDKVVTFLKTN